MATAEQRARFGGMTQTPVGMKQVSQPTAEQRARFGSMSPAANPNVQGLWNSNNIRPGYGGAPAGRGAGTLVGPSGGGQPAGAPGQPGQQPGQGGININAESGINPIQPYTNQDINQGASQLRNQSAQMPQSVGTPWGGGNALGMQLNDLMGSQGSLNANTFAPDARAANARFGLAGQKAQAGANQGWMNHGANMAFGDMNFEGNQQGYLLNMLQRQMA
jgi:hypothetical protein